MSPMFSIIVPVYNVENFIARCARSLFGQSERDIEYIFVNDCTKDCSMEVLHRVMDEYKQAGLNIKIITHEQNKGLPSARNSGMSVATGEYIYHCDSDDWIEENTMEKLHTVIRETHADIIWFDCYLSFRERERWIGQQVRETPRECLKAMLSGKMRFNVWNKLVKRKLYVEHAILFPDGYGMGEDMTMIKLFAFAEKVCHVPLPFYHYVQLNPNAFTKEFSDKHLLEVRHNTDETIRFVHSVFGNQFDKELQFLKLNVKFPFLISKEQAAYRRWLEWYPEAGSYIRQNKGLSLRARLLQQMALYHQFWFVRLHFLLFKIKYGIIYK